MSFLSLLHRWRKMRTKVLRLVFLMAAPALVFAPSFWPDAGVVETGLEIAGQLLVGVGILGRLWCTLYIGGRKSRSLVTCGPYALSRNPLYLFSFTLGLGVALLLQNALFLLLFAGLFLVTHAIAIRGEEQNLIRHFGSAYEHYRRTVPRFFPHLRQWRGGVVRTAEEQSISFSPRHLAQGLIESAVYLLFIPLGEILEELHRSGLLPL